MAACSNGQTWLLKASTQWKSRKDNGILSPRHIPPIERVVRAHFRFRCVSTLHTKDLADIVPLSNASRLYRKAPTSTSKGKYFRGRQVQATVSSQTAAETSSLEKSSSSSDSDYEQNLDRADDLGLRQPRVVQLAAQRLSPESFAPFGQVVEPKEDGTQFGPQDAALDISKGIPRVYVMRLRDKPLQFDRITHHAAVTQCLGAIGVASEPWYLAVAPPSLVDSPDAPGVQTDDERPVEQASRGHYYVAPRVDDVAVFRIDGPQVVKLHVGTWHAGPFFQPPTMDFCNLELSDTNVVDHTTHVFRSRDGVVFEIVDPGSNGRQEASEELGSSRSSAS